CRFERTFARPVQELTKDLDIEKLKRLLDDENPPAGRRRKFLWRWSGEVKPAERIACSGKCSADFRRCCALPVDVGYSGLHQAEDKSTPCGDSRNLDVI